MVTQLVLLKQKQTPGGCWVGEWRWGGCLCLCGYVFAVVLSYSAYCLTFLCQVAEVTLPLHTGIDQY